MYRETVEKIEEYSRKKGILKRNLGIVAGLSGGADSVFLLLVLKELQLKWGLRLVAVHVNHGIRGDEALRDEEFARKYAEGLGISFHRYCEDIPALAAGRHMSEEEAGREFRYMCFENVRRELDYDYIAVAHHREDQAETILFQMLRGSGIRGMGGMRAVRGRIIRPLLCVSKTDILQGLQERNIGYCTDSTNEENRYCRNKIRNEVFPLLQQVHGGAVEHLARMGEQMQDIMAFIDEQAQWYFSRLVRREETCLKVEEKAFLQLSDVMQREIILRMMEEAAGQKKDISSVHVEKMLGLVRGETGKRLDLPYGLQGRKEYSFAYIEKRTLDGTGNICSGNEDAGADGCLQGDFLPGELVLYEEMAFSASDGKKWFFRAEIAPAEKFKKINLKKYCTKCFDYDRMDIMPSFRYLEAGDFLWLDRAGHRKKVSRIFVDEKIPAGCRKRIPVLAVGSHVVWIPELNRQSAFYYVSEQTQNVLCVHRIIKEQ